MISLKYFCITTGIHMLIHCLYLINNNNMKNNNIKSIQHLRHLLELSTIECNKLRLECNKLRLENDKLRLECNTNDTNITNNDTNKQDDINDDTNSDLMNDIINDIINEPSIINEPITQPFFDYEHIDKLYLANATNNENIITKSKNVSISCINWVIKWIQ